MSTAKNFGIPRSTRGGASIAASTPVISPAPPSTATIRWTGGTWCAGSIPPGAPRRSSNDGVTDTYHYTNAAPQEHSFNDGLWGDVEDYILGLAKAKDHRITVFTGPVLADDDRNYGEDRPGGPWRVPVRFWKVICYVKADGTRSATGFLLDQADEIAGLLEGLTPLPQAREVAQVHQKAVHETSS